MAENIQLVDRENMVNSPMVFGEERMPISNTTDNEQQAIENEILELKVRNVAKELKNIGKGNLRKKAAVLITLKSEIPSIDVVKFIEQYGINNDHFEHMENFDLANEVENNFNLKKTVKNISKGATKAAKAVASVASSKIGSMAIGSVVSLVGTPAVGAATVAALGSVKKVVDKAKSLNLPSKEIKKIISQPEKASAVQLQAIAPDNALTSTLAPIVPLEKSMKDMLKNKGVSTTQATSLEDLASMFHDKIVLGKDNFDTSWYKNDIMYQNPVHHFEQNHLDFSKAGQIVNDIVGFFQKAKENPQTPIEEKAAKDVKQLEKEIATDQQKEIAQKVEQAQIIDKGFSINTIIIFAVIAVILFLVMRK